MVPLKLITLQALLALIFIACGNKKQIYKTEDVPSAKIASASKVLEKIMMADTIAAGTPEQENEQKNTREKSPVQKNKIPDKTDWDKKIIKNAALNLEVKDYKNFTSKMHDDVKQFGGYVSQEEQTETTYKIENNVTIKIPVDQFDNALNTLTASGEKLIEKKITSEDVTTEVVDTKSRMEAKKQARLRYLELLKQAKNMDEVLQVQNEIDEIQEQLESAAGRLAYLNHSSAYSTINLTFYQILDAGASTETEPTFLHKLKEAFGNGWRWMAELFIGLVSLWPLVIAIFIGVIFLRRRKFVKIKAG